MFARVFALLALSLALLASVSGSPVEEDPQCLIDPGGVSFYLVVHVRL